MEDLLQVAHDMNVLAGFVGTRDVDELEPSAIQAFAGVPRADVMVLFGGSILAGGDVLAHAMEAGVAETYVIAGGAGHTTETFRQRVHELASDVTFDPDAPEADVFAAYLRSRYGLVPDLLECASTNCGNNITYLVELLHDHGIDSETMIISQDATMQRRMDAGLRLFAPDIRPINFATYAVTVEVQVDADSHQPTLAYHNAPLGMWEPDRYLELLMGEIPRLTDDASGYGPAGAGYLVHVDVPSEVTAAFERLRGWRPDLVRTANPAFAG